MGNNQAKKPMDQMINTYGCMDDEMCKNIDSNRSTAFNTVYVCPGAKCTRGGCQCGPNCTKDPYTGMCCSRIETDSQGNTFCIEEPYKYPNQSNKKCSIPDQKINGTTVTGKQICEIYNKYNKYN